MFFFFYLFTVSHKVIGLLYFLLALVCGFFGYILSVFLRCELSLCGCGILFGDYQFYNVIITAHGLVMIFAFIMPIVLGGYTNYFAPLILGFPDMVFPRINNMSLWLFVYGVLLCVLGFFTEEGVGTGWTLYPTLICYDFHSSLACDFVIFAVHLLGISSILNSINCVGTFFVCRRKYYSFLFFVLFIWGVLLTCLLLIVCLPVLAGGVTMILLDRNFNTTFYDVIGGGDLVLFQHLFWFFGHPEVYIIILPIFGCISLLCEVMGLRCVFSCLAMIYSMIVISLLGFFVWAHHMFVVGMDCDSRAYFGSITLLIGLPTAIKLFNWLYSFLFMDFLFWWFDMIFVYLFVFMFLLGGITGLLLANCGLDIMLHDTYFVVAHFHYVLSLGAVLGVFGGFFHFCLRWFFVEYFSLIIYYFLFILWYGSNSVFFPLHSLGLLAFPRRITDYPQAFFFKSYIILIGLLFVLCLVLFCCCLFCLLLFFGDFVLFSFVLFIWCICCFFCFLQWLPICCILYLLLLDFLHIIIDYLFLLLCLCFVFYSLVLSLFFCVNLII